MRSIHCNKIDIQLNQTIRIITGTVNKSTQERWLPVLFNILLPEMYKKMAEFAILSSIENKVNLPIYEKVFHKVFNYKGQI